MRTRQLSIVALTSLSLLPNFGFFVSASWQDSGSSVEASKHANLSPQCFAPGGRLHSVERMSQLAVDADDTSNNLVAAIQCEDSVVVVSSLPESPYLPRNLTMATDKESPHDKNETEPSVFLPLSVPETGVARPPFLRLSNDMWGVTAGNSVDSQLLRLKLHRLAEDLREQDLGDRPDVMARRLADNLQVATQRVGQGRILASYAVIFTDKEIWRVDPTGQFWKCQACIIGRNCAKAESALTKKLETSNSDNDQDPKQTLSLMTQDDALALCRDCVSGTLDDVEDKRKTLPSAPVPPPTPLKGLSIFKRQATWFSSENLKSIETYSQKLAQ